jgi:hypothetical protein
MKKRQLFYLLFFIQFFSCQSPVKTGIVTSSFNVANSKENGVFIAEYIPEINKFYVGQKELQIDNVWVENQWMYKNYNRDIKKLDSKQGYVKFKNPDLDIFEIKFKCNGKQNGITGNKLSFDLNEYPETLTLNFMTENRTVKEIVLNRKKQTK